MTIFKSLATCLCSVALLHSAETSTNTIASTASQLDELASQEKVLTRKVGEPGFKPRSETVPPVSLQKIAAAAAPRLGLSEREVTKALKGDRQKLSELILARTLGSASGKSWKDLLAQNDRPALIQLAEQHGVTQKVQKIMDDLYVDISFAALDRITDKPAQGRAPAGTKGTAKQPKPQAP